MAHYDCSDCGASMGVGYGICTACTPQEVLEAGKRLQLAVDDARQEFRKRQQRLEHKFVEEKTRNLKRLYDTLYKANRPKSRRTP
jgi:predicted ATP-dependent serine protease